MCVVYIRRYNLLSRLCKEHHLSVGKYSDNGVFTPIHGITTHLYQKEHHLSVGKYSDNGVFTPVHGLTTHLHQKERHLSDGECDNCVFDPIYGITTHLHQFLVPPVCNLLKRSEKRID